MPGVPDIYQGTELWDNSLVDPDNRRPVDFAARRALLARLDAGWLPPVDASGAAKLLWSPRRCGCGGTGPSCSPATGRCPCTGRRAEHAVAFDRGGAVTVATRLPVGLARRGGWSDTRTSLGAAGTERRATSLTGQASCRSLTCSTRDPVALLTPVDRWEDP